MLTKYTARVSFPNSRSECLSLPWHFALEAIDEADAFERMRRLRNPRSKARPVPADA